MCSLPGKPFYIELLLLQLCFGVINGKETCNKGGICLRTWTMPVSDANTSTLVCECQSKTMAYFIEGVSCRGSDLLNGPRVRISEGYCMTFDEDSNITYLGRCPYNHINSTKHLKSFLRQSTSAQNLNSFMCSKSTYSWCS